MASIWDWSTTAATNGTADAGVNWAEGQTAASVNNSARAMMGRVKELLTDLGCDTSSTGAANAYALTTTSAFTAYASGVMVGFTANHTNTGTSTLNCNAIGAKTIYANGAVLTGGEITSGGAYVASYDAALNGAAGGWHLLNPKRPSALTTTSLAASAAITGGSSVTLTNATPQVILIQSGAAADNGRWDFTVNTEALKFRAVNDANSVVGTFLDVNRTGTTVDSLAFAATAMTFNGNTILHAGNGVFSPVTGTNPLVTTSGTAHAITWTAGDISELYIWVIGVSNAGADELCVRFTDDAAAHAYDATGYLSSVTEFSSNAVTHTTATTYIQLTKASTATNTWNGVIRIAGLNSALPAGLQSMLYADAGTERHCHAMGAYTTGRATTGIQFFTSAGSAFDAGNIYVYGKK
jgi:hypothetical protein